VTNPNHPLNAPRLRFCLRATVNALLAFALAHILAVPLHGVWAVPTAVMVIQLSIGGSLKAATDYFIGTIGGAVYASAVAALVPHPTVLALAGVLALAIAPLAYAAAANPSFRVAPVTAVLVLMISTQLGETPTELAFDRLLEVAVGGGVAIAVSLLVLPARAHALGMSAAVRALEHMAQVLPAVIAGFRSKRDPHQNVRLQDDVGEAVHAFAEVAGEAKPERLVHLASEPDPAMLARVLLRLRHDLVMIGRTASAPFPDPVAARLAPPLAQIAAAARDYLLASASALSARHASPPLEPVATAVTAYMSNVGSLRTEGPMDGLPVGERERIFALGFALEQLQQSFSELAACLQEWARHPDGATPWRWQSGLKHVAFHLASVLERFEEQLRRQSAGALRGALDRVRSVRAG
jgi:uncharacterized membrane protein YccC